MDHIIITIGEGGKTCYILRLDITPMLNNFVFKIFFFSLATTLVFLVSVFTAFVFMKIIEYLSSFVQVNTKNTDVFFPFQKIPSSALLFSELHYVS